jgi:hypothetical protein
MNIEQYFRSLGSEVEALKSRVRDLKDSTHWQTDGEWKESVLRTVLRRNLPDSIGVGNGFVVAGHRSSHQLDIIVYERSAPILSEMVISSLSLPTRFVESLRLSRGSPQIVSEPLRTNWRRL